MSLPKDQLDQLKVAQQAVLIQDQARMFNSQQALTDFYHNKMLGVPIPEDEMIHVGDYYSQSQPTPPQFKSGVSILTAIAWGAVTAAIPIAAAAGFLLSRTSPLQERTIEKVIPSPSQTYGVNVDMEVIPPSDSNSQVR